MDRRRFENSPRLERRETSTNPHPNGCHALDAVVTGHEVLIEGLELPTPNDRHVLAVAILAKADMILTFNLKDFPTIALRPFTIEGSTPINSFWTNEASIKPQSFVH
jgi:hypothetical protein